jgi:hypothetical protein
MKDEKLLRNPNDTCNIICYLILATRKKLADNSAAEH